MRYRSGGSREFDRRSKLRQTFSNWLGRGVIGSSPMINADQPPLNSLSLLIYSFAHILLTPSLTIPEEMECGKGGF